MLSKDPDESVRLAIGKNNIPEKPVTPPEKQIAQPKKQITPPVKEEKKGFFGKLFG